MKKKFLYKKYQIIIALIVIILVVSGLYCLLGMGSGSNQNQEATLQKANQLFESGDRSDAIVILERYLKTNPEDNSAANKLAYYYYQQKQYDDFIRIFEEKDLDSLSSINIAATIYLGKGEVEKAQELYEKSLQDYPKNTQSYINYATFCQSSGKINEAMEVIKQGLKLLPTSTKLLVTAASIAMKMGDSEGAVIYAREALLIDQDNQQAKSIIVSAGG